jgi:hypothetical protein
MRLPPGKTKRGANPTYALDFVTSRWILNTVRAVSPASFTAMQISNIFIVMPVSKMWCATNSGDFKCSSKLSQVSAMVASRGLCSSLKHL